MMNKAVFLEEVQELIDASKIKGMGMLGVVSENREFGGYECSTLQFEVSGVNLWKKISSRKIGDFDGAVSEFNIQISPADQEIRVDSSARGTLIVTLHDFKNYSKVVWG